MHKATKKEIRQAVETSIRQVLLIFDVSQPSSKVLKLLDRLSKKVAEEIRTAAKKKHKTFKKVAKSSAKALQKGVAKKL